MAPKARRNEVWYNRRVMDSSYLTCSRCRKEKSADCFASNNDTRSPTGRKKQSHCRDCKAEYQHEWYNSKPEHKARRIAQARASEDKAKQFILAYLLTHPCIDCGEGRPVVLEFDHVRGDKITEVTRAAQRGWGLQKLQKEIDKCDVRCANCHRYKTSVKSNSYRLNKV